MILPSDESPSPSGTQPTTRGLKFVPEVSAGNLLQAFVLIAMVLVWGLRLEGRVDSEMKLRDEQHADTLTRLDRADQQHRDDLRDIKDGLTRIESKLDQKADKLK